MKIVGVTACMSGVAHTYMAAELLEKMAKKAGHSIMVETQGAFGSDNVLMDADIASADAVVIVADINIEGSERFEKRRVLRTYTSTFLKNPEIVLCALDKVRVAPPGTSITL
ncbi:PTS system mannose-specific EIIBCA component [Pseudovibrio axinellae]|uniref:protein-N(pi)-phosphohistidine--D-fructose phosphotransferase n=1 Tax=Pseudovibrio axinellae TaxID=989403 RepID=A0A165VZQ6_9HYPH|nr:PTS fructose transporter subunit IIB [Pseudovibrio axinellae]KZL15724.1 PTS system mannose-specific EIIBCA component [Pseudovibrio axinellae]SER80764.1 PTS system unknown substrate IIB component 2, Fru family [Pseudovibrio axinellae]